jgi:DNA-binding MarR family transcriptional regulator
VSRGLGSLQRRICESLAAAEGHELPLRELRRRLGEPDRSNLRRAIRGLLERSLVEESHSGRSSRGGRLALTSSGLLRMRPPPPVHLVYRPRMSIRARLREELRALQEAREEEESRRLETKATASPAAGPSSVDHEHIARRGRSPGHIQRSVLYVLWKYADHVGEGLPVGALKAIVGGDRSNTRRAIRTLLRRGELEESEDGKRVRLSRSAAFRSPQTPRRLWRIRRTRSAQRRSSEPARVMVPLGKAEARLAREAARDRTVQVAIHAYEQF